jgi:hypothetical protein
LSLGVSGPGGSFAVFVFLAIVLPIVAYVLAFTVIPWIAKGFK